MNEDTDTGWFETVNPDNLDGAHDAVEHGIAESPMDWPTYAVESGFADDEDDYYAKLHGATTMVARDVVRDQEMADDQQLKHSVRAMDDLERTANELAERLSEWAGTLFSDAGAGVEYASELADRTPEGPVEERVIGLAGRIDDLASERDELREFVERRAPDVAPNLSALADPVLATRLIALAGGLESLAKMPSGTVQVLGAEDALFAHLRGHASSPKHGIIFTHEYVRGTESDERGSAARALAGKLTIAARVDHYAGDYRPELKAELDERIERIRSRGEGE